VIALTLMAFVLLLLLTVQVLLRVEISSAAIQASRNHAQQNALLGLQIALGELQKHTGVDQVVTGRAELLDTVTSTQIVDGIANPYWTGVWKNDGTLLTWLVSGNNGDSPLNSLADSTTLNPNSPNVVALVGENTVQVTTGSATLRYAYAPKQAITGDATETGKYAYWIGDEGVKSKINLTIEPRNDLLDPQKISLISAQQNGVNAITGLEDFPLTTPQEVSRLSDVNQLDILIPSTVNNASALRFHDLTTHGFGVLADVAKGGLKKDLTIALATGASQPSGSIFAPISQHPSTSGTSFTSTTDPGGPLWQQLRSWVNYPSNPSGELLVRPTSDTQAGLSPVITGVQFFCRLTYETNASGMTGNYFVHIIPAVVLWNPYNVSLATEDYTVRLAKNLRNGAEFTYLAQAGGIFLVELQNGESTFEDADSDSAADYTFRRNGQTHLIFHIPNVSLAPGEAMIFSPPVNGNIYHQPFNYTTTPIASDNQLAPGLNLNGSFYFRASNRSLYADTTNGDYYNDYSPRFITSSVLSVRLSKGMGRFAETDVLSEALYLNTGMTATPASLTMNAFDSTTPFAVDEVSDYFGFKAIRTFVDTVSITSTMSRTRKWLANYNPRSRMQGASPYEFTMPSSHYRRNPNNNPSFSTNFETDGTYAEVDTLEGTSTFVGLSESLSVGAVSRASLFEVPESLLWIHSIGQLMHAPLYRYFDSSFNPGNDDEALTEYLNRYARFDNLTPAYAIGNSLANPHIPLNSLYKNWADLAPSQSNYFGFEGLLYDYSYLLNEALWDRYFYSTVPATGNIAFPLPNGRIVSASNLSFSNSANLRNFDQASAGLMVNGSFNVNSTSIEAWKALFASFYGIDVTPTDGAKYTADLNNPESPILRLNNPMGEAYKGVEGSTNLEVFDGYRILTRDQITALATAMVQEVKARGPFTSLANFVNRSIEPTDNDAHKLSGALQAAINASGLNAELEDFPITASGVNGMEPLAEAGWASEGTPGALTQADILARVGATLSPRSDTFRIRAYGETSHPTTGAPDSKAWCEAIVQRIPEFVDAQANVAWTPLDDNQAALDELPPLSAINQQFGRGYQIVEFRWLSADEI